MSAFTTELHDSIAVVTIDLPGEPVNKLNSAVKVELEALLIRLRDDAEIRGVVFISGKPDTFIAGADIEEFTALTTQAEAERLSFEGQEMVNRIEALPKPVVAAIHGACLGGGLELALACHYRVATDHPKTQLGLPEVQLGLLPGAGGCQRLPRLIGLRAALDMILTGKSERAAKALRLGLVDEVVPRSILLRTALAAAQRFVRDGLPRPQRTRRTPRPLPRPHAGGAPAGLSRGEGGGPEADRRPLPGAAGGAGGGAGRHGARHHRWARRGAPRLRPPRGGRRLPQAGADLLRHHRAQEGRRDRGRHPPALARSAGSASSGRGSWARGSRAPRCVNVEVDTRLKDADLARVGKGLGAARAILADRLHRRRVTQPQHERLSALLSGGDTYAGFGRADLVIEAVFEELSLKRRVLAEVEEVTRPDTIFASNTSTIPIHQIAAEARRPERVLGMHFFSPVEKMPLLEVIPTDATAPEAIVTAVRFGRRMGKTVIVVGDKPGFWVNRILSPYLNEAGLMVAEGMPIELIDRTATAWGFPVGPIALLDEIGLDVAHKAAETMHAAFGDRMKGGNTLDRMLAAGRLGRKNGRGFYRYSGGHKKGADPTVYGLLGTRPVQDASAELIERRLVYSMLNEAAGACAEDVIRNARDGDIGAIYGIGFPAFRGGPLRAIDDLGASRVVSALHELEDQYGDRFRPAPALAEMARQGGRYYAA